MKYAKPEIEIITLNTMDVITTSAGGDTGDPGNNRLPIVTSADDTTNADI